MRFIETELDGAYIVEPELIEDARGYFARSWGKDEFLDHGLNPDLVQCSMSFNHRRGTLRGMHWQGHPAWECKLIRCTTGAIFDVIVDLRADSRTYGCWKAFELDQANRRALYVPEGFAHGFQTLVDGTEVFYQITHAYSPSLARGFRWDDATVGIDWPVANPILSDRDRDLPLLEQTTQAEATAASLALT